MKINIKVAIAAAVLAMAVPCTEASAQGTRHHSTKQEHKDNSRSNKKQDKNTCQHGHEYHCDKSHVCYNGNIIKGADTKTFKQLGDGYAKDKSNVYYEGERIKGADAKTFKYIERGMAKDKKRTYINGQPKK